MAQWLEIERLQSTARLCLVAVVRHEQFSVDKLDVRLDTAKAVIERVEEGDAGAFWELVRENGDELRWCGASPLYTFLRSAPPGARGAVELYEQWNIDEASVVSFAALTFSRGSAATATVS